MVDEERWVVTRLHPDLKQTENIEIRIYKDKDGNIDNVIIKTLMDGLKHHAKKAP